MISRIPASVPRKFGAGRMSVALVVPINSIAVIWAATQMLRLFLVTGAVMRTNIDLEDHGGWVRVFLKEGEPTDELGGYLSHVLSEWSRGRQHLRFRFIYPVTRGGDTVELHAWYDQVVFRDKSPLSQQLESPG
jgi:hypothetical protein